MSQLLYRTIADERPQGKPNVYFSCYPGDLGKYFDEYALKILRIQDCAVWYESKPDEEYDLEDLQLRLSQMQLFVMPVTTELLTKPNRAMDEEFELAQEKHIPVLPLMMEQGLDDVYRKRFGDLQYLDPNNAEDTKRSFDEMLASYIKATLVSGELATKVRAAFDAYIFLSYRKKDRKKAQELMRLIHKNPLCRDIAIWYDEFLTPGEDFNQAIGEMLEKSDLFTLAVTPNLVNEINYVMTTEYPAALAQNKPVLPVEMVDTDRSALEEHYEDLPPCVRGEDGEEFRNTLLEKLKAIAVTANDEDPQHNYLIGLAYLDGIDVEVNSERALELITGAAEAGVPEAMSQLVTMYETGKGVKRDRNKGIRWRQEYILKLRDRYLSEHSDENALNLIYEIWDQADALDELRLLDEAQELYNQLISWAEYIWITDQKDNYRRFYGIGYSGLGDIAMNKGDFSAAQEYYEKGLEMTESLVKEKGTVMLRRDLSNRYADLGGLAEEKKEFEKAQEYYEKCFEIRKKLAEETGTVISRGYLSTSLMDLGDVSKEKGDFSAAKEYYEKSLVIIKELADETGTESSQNRLGLIYNRLGLLAGLQGNLSEEKEYYNKSLNIDKILAEKLGTIYSLQNLSTSYYNLGTVAKEEGDMANAKYAVEKAFQIRDALSQTGTLEARQDLSNCYMMLGEISESMRDLPSAKEYYEKELEIRQAIAEEADNDQVLYELAVCCFSLAAFYHNKLHDTKKGKEMFRRVVEIGEHRDYKDLNVLTERARKGLDIYTFNLRNLFTLKHKI